MSPVAPATGEATGPGDDRRTRLLGIIARATPTLARSGPAYRIAPDQDAARLRRLAETWAALPHAPAVPAVSTDALEARFRDVEVIDPTALPAWAARLLVLWPAAFPADADEAADAERAAALAALEPFGALAPILVGGRRLLDDRIRSAGADVATSGAEGMLAVLGQRLWRMADQWFAAERRMAAASGGFLKGLGMAPAAAPGDSEADWLERLERAPVLAYLLGLTVDHWLVHTGEILDRLVSDGPLLRERLFGGMAPGALVAFQGDTGDVHNGGRAVAILGFAHGGRAVYKPKDLRISVAFAGLVTALDEAGLEPPLPVPVVLDRGGYAWEAHVAHRPCPDTAALDRFYRRMGAYVRLFQLLEARDLWLDNLVASGEDPVFIDLETLLQPRRRPDQLLPAEQLAQDRLEESVVPTCVVAMPTPIEPGVAAEDLGAFAAARTYLSPFPRPGARPTAVSLPEERFMTWTHPEHAPTLAGEPVRAQDHLAAILAGYRDCQVVLEAIGDRLAAPDGPLAPFREAPVRFIFRDTWSCLKLVRRSSAPALLGDPAAREQFLERLHGTIGLGVIEPAFAELHGRLLAQEITGLGQLDVPLFRSLPDSDGVWCPDGSVVPGFFAGTAWDRLQARVRSLATFPLEAHVDLLRSTFATGHAPDGSEPLVVRPADAVVSRGGSVDPAWVTLASAIGEGILGDAWRGPDGDLAWVGVGSHPNLDLHAVEVLRPDLLSGTCGSAVLFAELARATGDDRWAEAATGALRGTLRTVADVDVAWADLRTPGAPPRTVPPACGAWYGVGSHLLTLGRCGDALGRPELDDLAAGYLARLPLDAIMAGASVDAVSGVAGLALVLTSPATSGVDGVRATARRVLATIETRRAAGGGWPAPPYPPGIRWLDGLPGTAVALALARARGGEAPTGESLAGGSLSGGSRLTAGDLAAWLGVARTTQDAGTARAALTHWETWSGDPLDELEVALAAHALTGEAAHAERARMAGRHLLARHARTGSWFTGSFAADAHRLSAVSGLVAVALGFLRLAALEPGRIQGPGPASLRLAG